MTYEKKKKRSKSPLKLKINKSNKLNLENNLRNSKVYEILNTIYSIFLNIVLLSTQAKKVC